MASDVNHLFLTLHLAYILRNMLQRAESVSSPVLCLQKCMSGTST